MVLTGDGADEVLAGYTTYRSESFASTYQKLPGFARHLLPGIINLGSAVLTGNLRYKANQAVRVLNNFNSPFQARLISKSTKISTVGMKALYNTRPLQIEDFVADVFKDIHLKDPFYQLTYYNLKVSLPGQMLVKVDRMSMAHSLETRARFLTTELLNICMALIKR